MAYGKGRLWVARENSYVGGDIVGGDGTLESVLKFTENTFLAEGGSFYVPSSQGDCRGITGLAFASNLDTTLGQGELLVFTSSSIFAFDAPIDRLTWKNLNYPIQKFALGDYGSMSQESIVSLNGDLMFRGRDGIKSFILARRDFQQVWGNTPIDNEETRALQYDDQSLLYQTSAVKFDNRMLMTIGPTNSDRGIVHRGLAVLDFDLVSGLKDKAPPSWEGVWTGVKWLRLHTVVVNGQQACFAFGVDESGGIGLWEITTGDRYDNDIVPINWIGESRLFGYEKKLTKKKLNNMELWIENAVDTFSTQAYYRSDGRRCWSKWSKYTDCAKSSSCDDPDDYCGLIPHQPQVRNRVVFNQPRTEDCGVEGPHNIGYEHQVRLENKGSFVIKTLRLSADQLPEGIGSNVSTCP